MYRSRHRAGDAEWSGALSEGNFVMAISRPAFCRLGAFLGMLVAASGFVWAQPPPPSDQQTPPQPAPEVSSRDAIPTFTSRVNLVPVSVVVRNSSGHTVGNLTKDDFQLTDDGKPQATARFSIERSDAPVVVEKQARPAPQAPGATPARPEAVIATRFVAYLFDDIHLNFEDIAFVRDAATRQVTSSLQPADRVAIYTTSGRNMLEFTDDRAALQTALARLRPNPITGGSGSKCPDISYYMADQIVNKSDGLALRVALAQYAACSGNMSVLPVEVRTRAQFALNEGAQETRIAARVLRDAVRRLSAMPGQRVIVLTSPGFLVEASDHSEIADIISKAISARVIVNCLDARGVWTPPGYDASNSTPEGGATVITMITTYRMFEASIQGQVLSEVAEGTGGLWIHDTNDIPGAFRRLATPPDFYYVLAFSPDNLKSDGKYHNLKVTLRNPKGLTLQARKGYYAPRRETSPAEKARQDLEDAVFTRDVVKDLPVEFHIESSRPAGGGARISVLARLDLRGLQFRKVEDRNLDNLVVVAALFDNGGNYIAGMQKGIELRLKDETLADLTGPYGHGLAVHTSFDVKPGSYVVRLVVRDSEGRFMTSENGVVDIP